MIDRVNRTKFFGRAVACALLMGLMSVTGHLEPTGRPNILLIIADDWSFPHAGVYGDQVVRTPNFDRLAREGALFTNAYTASPSCTPSRAGLLTGRLIHQLEDGGNLWSVLAARFAVYPDLLEKAGYRVGHTRKGWGPGNFEEGGRVRNPAGPQFQSFATFLSEQPAGEPFCFWFGSQDPHRDYVKGSGRAAGMRPELVRVPPHLPDTPEVRGDILDYYFEVERLDREVGELLTLLEKSGQLDRTLIVMTSDNGMPFPRAKANLYDSGTRMPLAIRWPERIRAGQVHQGFVSLTDLAPTFLEAAGLPVGPEMTGRSLWPSLSGGREPARGEIFLERERHANVRRGDLSYPVRAIRTADFLYIRNLRPDRWPAGDPEKYHSVGRYGDIDDGPSKQQLLADHRYARYFRLAMAKRPPEELYDLRRDPGQINNVAGQIRYRARQRELSRRLDHWMRETADPRATVDDDRYDRYRYFGPPAK
ncbi:MAG: sulfatase [Blastocatellia bacterium]|jgi:N-sulfoglucosamine sulfohydrolase